MLLQPELELSLTLLNYVIDRVPGNLGKGGPIDELNNFAKALLLLRYKRNC